MEANESEPLYESVESTNRLSKQEESAVFLDKCRGHLITACTTPGAKVARPYYRHNYGTREAVVAMTSETFNRKASGRVRVAMDDTVADWPVVARKHL